MLKIILITVCISTSALAKFNPPEGYVPSDERNAVSEFLRLDTNKDGSLSPDEYNGKLERKLTREQEKLIRRAKKKGTYQTPEQQFKSMDTETTGQITLNQFIQFYLKMEREDKGKGSYY